MIDLIFFIAEILFIVSYLYRDMLYLRLISASGSVLYIVAASIAGFKQPGMTTLIVFAILGFLINGYQICQIIISRWPVLLPEDLKEIYSNTFAIMTPNEFFKIYKKANIKKYIKGGILAIQNRPIPELIMLKSGTVKIIKNDVVITELSSGYFIGEMSFLTGEMATATVEVSSDELECVVWEKTKLASLERQNEELYKKVKQAIALNLVKKLDKK